MDGWMDGFKKIVRLENTINSIDEICLDSTPHPLKSFERGLGSNHFDNRHIEF